MLTIDAQMFEVFAMLQEHIVNISHRAVDKFKTFQTFQLILDVNTMRCIQFTMNAVQCNFAEIRTEILFQIIDTSAALVLLNANVSNEWLEIIDIFLIRIHIKYGSSTKRLNADTIVRIVSLEVIASDVMQTFACFTHRTQIVQWQ